MLLALLLLICATVAATIITRRLLQPAARKAAVPAELTAQAEVPDLAGVRYRPGHDTARLAKDAVAAYYQEIAWREAQGALSEPPVNLHNEAKQELPQVSYLALSGGGDNGAFGAGLLNGWSAAGNRPEFKWVTGVSTGALIAPLAFLGPDYDHRLKQFYTESSPADILELRGYHAALTSDAMADHAPLLKRLRREVTQQMLDAIAAEHHKGRVLLVATADLDARQPVLWNLTRIAASKSPNALSLFHSILLASAAVPGVFPPVMIDVEAGGRPYQEMHVDGGTMSQLFLYPPALQIKQLIQQHGATRERRVYVIRNARLDPDWAHVDRRVMTIAGRAISSLIHTQGIGDLYQVYMATQRDNVDFNLACIPASFNALHREDFDTDYMRALYQTGYEMAAKGYPWEKAPPGLWAG